MLNPTHSLTHSLQVNLGWPVSRFSLSILFLNKETAVARDFHSANLGSGSAVTYHSSAYIVVRAISQVSGGGSFLAHGVLKPLNWLSWNLPGLIISAVRPYTQNTVAAVEGVGWGDGSSYTSSRAFWFLERTHSLPREAQIYAQCTRKHVLVVGAFLWSCFAQGQNLPHFYPIKPFFNRPNKAIILRQPPFTYNT